MVAYERWVATGDSTVLQQTFGRLFYARVNSRKGRQTSDFLFHVGIEIRVGTWCILFYCLFNKKKTIDNH